ncbi:MAG: glycosyltransferase family 2 protein [Pseudomonadota bacterium]
MSNITICILSLNRLSYLREALDSALHQTVKPAAIKIFDNGSENGFKDALLDYFESGVEWFGSETTQSAIWNFKRAVSSVTTENVLVLHDDDRLCPDFIEQQTKFLDFNRDIDAVSCNGFFINEDGHRSGGTLRPEFTRPETKIFESSSEVALEYASDSCIPFSPVVYKTASVKNIDFRTEFGKVCDAVFFCDMADIGKIAYQSTCLYECRVHAEQDSASFPQDQVEMLENFFWSTKGTNKKVLKRLRMLLARKYTRRVIYQIDQEFKKNKNLIRMTKISMKIFDKQFSALEALKFVLAISKSKAMRLFGK